MKSPNYEDLIKDISLDEISNKLEADKEQIFSIIQLYATKEVEDIMNNQRKSLELWWHSDDSYIRSRLVIEVCEQILVRNEWDNG